MIKNKHISKITMLTALFIAGMVNAQEFYTCVPKKNTCDNSVKFSNIDELKQAIADGVAKGMQNSGTANNQSSGRWQFIYECADTNYCSDIKMTEGLYKVDYCDDKKCSTKEFYLVGDQILYIKRSEMYIKYYGDEVHIIPSGYNRIKLYKRIYIP